jgi:predicted transcriptional regulator
MLTIDLTPDIELRIEHLARALGRPKEEFVKDAIFRYVEDQEDIARARTPFGARAAKDAGGDGARAWLGRLSSRRVPNATSSSSTIRYKGEYGASWPSDCAGR